ncbi:MAG: inositol monophosphatase family protein [Thermoguttaceae bacterium]
MTPLTEYQRVCEEAVRAGVAAIKRHAAKFSVRKKGPADLVTEADTASQQAIIRVIRSHFPEHRIIGEEDTEDSSKILAPENISPYRWIIDPLDGTTNFVHGVPHYCVSIALERQGELLVGAVLDPALDEYFTAAAGQGAKLNGRPIHSSNVTEMSESLGVVGFPPGVSKDSLDLAVFVEAISYCQSIRRSGSAALNLAYVAAGRYDLMWTFSTKIWDIAAGVLLIREAGGAVCATSGGDFQLDSGTLLAAANPALLCQLRGLVESAIKLRDSQNGLHSHDS